MSILAGAKLKNPNLGYATDFVTQITPLLKDIHTKKIKIISLSNFTGIINVGERRKSDFENYKRYKSCLKPCRRRDILKNLNFRIAKDSSMNLNLLKKIINW